MIVVTGMHRSGTSVVAGVLRELGIEFGDPGEFYAADQWNERGYFERRDVIDINSRMVTGRTRTTSAMARFLGQLSYASMPPPADIRRRATPLSGALGTFGESLAGIAVKDPRFCLTLGIWSQSCEIESVVVSIRHPSGVAQSLRRRQKFPLALGYRFWNYHISELLAALDGTETPVLVIDYDVLSSTEFLGELGLVRRFFDLPLNDDELTSRFQRVYSSELRHFQRTESELPPDTAALWSRLLARRAGRVETT